MIPETDALPEDDNLETVEYAEDPPETDDTQESE